MYVDAALAEDIGEDDDPAPTDLRPAEPQRRPRRRRAALLAATALVAVAMSALTYQPLGPGSVIAANQHLLVDATQLPPTHGVDSSQFRYRFQAATSYETMVSVRNDGPLPVVLEGIDGEVASGTTLARPAELRLLPPGSLSAFNDWGASQPWQQTVIGSGQQLTLWIRWETSPCPPQGALLGTSASASVSSLPLRWSVAGIPRRSVLDLGYTVRFEVTPQTWARQCLPSVEY
jgi:hypothetical protein